MTERSDRQSQKDRLRQGMVDSGAEKADYREGKKRPSLRVILIIGLIIIAACGGIYLFLSTRHMADYSIVWEKQDTAMTDPGTTFKGYEIFSGGIINYSKDGASYSDKKGDAVWERSYQMNSPRAFVREGYAAIADIGGTQLYIFDTETNTGAVETAYPLVDAAVSAEGVVYTVLSDGNAEYINAYRADGSPIDLSVKSLMTGDGYPLDISASPSGSQLITAYVGVNGSSIGSSVVFRNFDDIGQNADARRIVGGFADEFEGHYVGKVNFSTEDHSQAFFDGGIVFFSTRVLTSPEVIARADFDNEIRSVACSDKYVAVILSQDNAEMPYRLAVFNADGGIKGEASFDMQYTGFDICGNEIYIYNDSELRIYSAGGNEKADIVSEDFSFSKVVRTGLGSEYMIADGNDLICIRLQ